MAKNLVSQTSISVLDADPPVARGFIPDRLRSSRENCRHDQKAVCIGGGLLRRPSGMNPLATGRAVLGMYFRALPKR
ncbi:hypothetical protein EMIT0P260_160013 [Pseudomonas sp. IT-P260]